ncbi:MAG: hypothetical protein ACFFAQ_01995 [Promethearchaeota archaeon]
MIKDLSETKADLTCEECGEPIKHNQIDNKPIYCEFCGAQYSSVDLRHPEISQPEQERIRFSYTTEELSQAIRNLTYQKIYELLKANFSIISRLKDQEDLKQSQILKLAKKLRRALLFLSLPSNNTELLTKTSKKKIENFFEDFQANLKKKRKKQSNYVPYLTKNIKFIYRLIKGDFEFSTLAKYNQKAVNKLKTKFGFKINAKTKNAFSYYLSILLCRKIYKIITTQGQILDLKHSRNELTKQYTLNTAKDITALVLNNYFKGNFSKAYRKLKMELEIDWVYRESFIDHVRSLIKLVYKLAYNNGYTSRLGGFQKLFAEDLKESRFFEDDTIFSPYFKVNLTLILSRIIHCILNSSQNLTPLQSDPRKLNPTDNLRSANEILDELLADKKIKSEFLKEFYNLSLEEFQKEYENLLAKLKSDMLYKENFLSFLQKLINSVYKITHIKSKKSNHSKIELGIIKDLANYNFNWESLKKEKSCFYSEEKDKRYDIFTTEIPENSLLWRVRAYVIGFLLSDGSIRYNPYEVAASQNLKDRDILDNIKKALGGDIQGPDKKSKYYWSVYNKSLVLTLKKYGMVKAHSKEHIAKNLVPPDFITLMINGKSILRDFIRGFYDGDGWITGSFIRGDTGFKILGPEKFLTIIQEMISIDVPDIKSYITPERKQYFFINNKKYLLFTKSKIYKKGYGFYKLSTEEKKKGEIKILDHPWLKILHFSGNLNATKFFNWLYEDNDKFDQYEINGIKICGTRKFRKAISILGDKKKRKERLAPDWKDTMTEIIPKLKARFYKITELRDLTNDLLLEELRSLGLEHLYDGQKAKNMDKFRERLKFFEYLDNLLGHYKKSNINYYFSKINPPSIIPKDFKRSIYLIKNGDIRKNIKSFIIYVLLLKDNPMKFDEILKELKKSKIFDKNTLYIKNIIINIVELISFEIIFIEELKKPRFIFKNFKDQDLYLNISRLKVILGIDLKEIKLKLKKLYYK